MNLSRNRFCLPDKRGENKPWLTNQSQGSTTNKEKRKRFSKLFSIIGSFFNSMVPLLYWFKPIFDNVGHSIFSGGLFLVLCLFLLWTIKVFPFQLIWLCIPHFLVYFLLLNCSPFQLIFDYAFHIFVCTFFPFLCFFAFFALNN